MRHDIEQNPVLPMPQQIEGLLGLRGSAGISVSDLITHTLILPLNEFLNRPAKRFRSQLVEAGFSFHSAGVGEDFARGRQALCRRASELLESLHAGSLVVDDIEDGSSQRRGAPALHLKLGLSVALNAGNWLYFWPMEQVRNWGLEPQDEIEIYHLCHRTLLRAHFGQALDVGTRIDTLPQDRVASVCLASLELKTGALTALGLSLGAVLAGATSEVRAALDEFGHAFGVALQMFDDVGNLVLSSSDPKRYEDLRLRRPSWIWAMAAGFGDAAYRDFCEAVSLLPSSELLESWVEKMGLVKKAQVRANLHLSQAHQRLRESLPDSEAFEVGLLKLENLSESLRSAYG